MKKEMYYEDIIDLFRYKVDENERMNLKDIRYCYGMSKMTIEKEIDGGNKYYNRIKFVEFLEMIGRVADLRFRDSEMEEFNLATKIEYLLDDLLPCFDLTRIPV